MRSFRRTFGLIAAIALLAGLISPISLAAAQDATGSDTADLTVTMTEAGTFGISLSMETGGAVSLVTSATQQVSAPINVQMRMYLTDTKSYRNAFNLALSATPYTSNLQIPFEPSGTFYAFPDDALKLYSTRNPRPGRWDFPGATVPYTGPNPSTHPVGNLFPMRDDGTVITTYRPVGGDQADVWATNNTLVGASRLVTQADAGAGTLNSNQAVIMRLTVPAGMPAATYTSVITVTATPVNAP